RLATNKDCLAMTLTEILRLWGIVIGTSASIFLTWTFYQILTVGEALLIEPTRQIAFAEFFLAIFGVVGLLLPFLLDGRRRKLKGRTFSVEERIYLGWDID
ncbi:MAG TPA: hypothetical protein VEP90_25040, partial [Methylomirabilota bacterium]|nr:hypothetical protein [Methylomirabilota bacterium]